MSPHRPDHPSEDIDRIAPGVRSGPADADLYRVAPFLRNQTSGAPANGGNRPAGPDLSTLSDEELASLNQELTTAAGASLGLPEGADLSTLSESDMLALMIRALFEQMFNPPETEFPEDLAIFQAETLESLERLLTLQRSFQTEAMGFIPTPSGQFISTDEYNRLAPQDKSLVDEYRGELKRRQENEYRSLQNDFYLMQEDFTRGRRDEENLQIGQELQDTIAANRERLSLNEADLNRAVQNISRHLQGLGESRSRAGQEFDQLLEAAGYAETDPRLGPQRVASRFTGEAPPEQPTIRLSPGQLISDYDRRLGVEGPIPQVPGERFPIQPSETPQYIRPPTGRSPLVGPVRPGGISGAIESPTTIRPPRSPAAGAASRQISTGRGARSFPPTDVETGEAAVIAPPPAADPSFLARLAELLGGMSRPVTTPPWLR